MITGCVSKLICDASDTTICPVNNRIEFPGQCTHLLLVLESTHRWLYMKERNKHKTDERGMTIIVCINHRLVVTNFMSNKCLCLQLLPEKLLQGLTILRELLNTFVQFVEGHLVLEKCPAELGLVVDVGDFRDRLSLGG